MKKIVIGITSPASVILIEGQQKYFADKGYQTYLICPPHERVTELCKKENCIHLPVQIEREISLFKDIRSLFTIIRYFIKIKPDIVNVGTPKMGMLGTVAAWLTRVPVRIYTCRGFRFEHVQGPKRKVLILMEKITARLTKKIICISSSVRTLGIDLGVFSAKKSMVINKGSSNGINLARFKKDMVPTEQTAGLKKELGLADHNFVYGFVGRIIDRKGINELFAAFKMIYENNADVRLLIVGRFEEEQIADKTLLQQLEKHPAVIVAGPQMDVPLYLSVMDVFVLPAWWEGFGNVLVQAAAMGIAVISTDATGCKDAVSQDYNGILVEPKNIPALKAAMDEIKNDAAKRHFLGENGVKWSAHFDNQVIWSEMEKLYNSN